MTSNIKYVEKIIEAHYSAEFLVKDLRDMAESGNLLLAENGINLLRQAANLKRKLKQLESDIRQEGVEAGNGEAQ